MCVPCEHGMPENPGPLCGKSCSQLLSGLPEFLLLWHSPGSCVCLPTAYSSETLGFSFLWIWLVLVLLPIVFSLMSLGLSAKLKSEQRLKGQHGGLCCEGLVPSNGGNSSPLDFVCDLWLQSVLFLSS